MVLFACSDLYKTLNPPNTLVDTIQFLDTVTALRFLRQKGCSLQVAESLSNPEGLNPFKNPACPTDKSLASFDTTPTVTIVDRVLTTSDENLGAQHGKGGKSDFIISKSISNLISHVAGFAVLLLIITSANSWIYLTWKIAEDYLRLHLPVCVMWFFHIYTQAFLRSCSKASSINEVTFHFIHWENNFIALQHGFGDILNTKVPSFAIQVKPPSKDIHSPPSQHVLSHGHKSYYGIAAINTAKTNDFLLNICAANHQFLQSNLRIAPPFLTNNCQLCPEFHLMKHYPLGRNCPQLCSHIYLRGQDWDKFLSWNHKLSHERESSERSIDPSDYQVQLKKQHKASKDYISRGRLVQDQILESVPKALFHASKFPKHLQFRQK